MADPGACRPSPLAEEALRRGKALRRRRRLVERAVAGVALAGVTAAVTLGIAIKPAQPVSPVNHLPRAVTTTSSLPMHGARPGGHTPAPTKSTVKGHPHKPVVHATSTTTKRTSST